jgi:hypothetical protein
VLCGTWAPWPEATSAWSCAMRSPNAAMLADGGGRADGERVVRERCPQRLTRNEVQGCAGALGAVDALVSLCRKAPATSMCRRVVALLAPAGSSSTGVLQSATSAPSDPRMATTAAAALVAATAAQALLAAQATRMRRV